MTTTNSRVSRSLQAFFFLRSGVAFAWVAIAAIIGGRALWLGPALLGVYMLWDVLANVLDAQRTRAIDPSANVGGQRVNAIVSAVAAAVALSGLAFGITISVVAFGLWALGAGILQLVVALRRRREVSGGQWFLIASGAQSAIAGLAFTAKGLGGKATLADLIPYAAFGGTYFLASAITLAVRNSRAQGPAVQVAAPK